MISSEPIRRHIEVTRTARYYEIGDLDEPCDDLWFVLHGYAQSALDFAESFNEHGTPGRLIVVPEALSRFYVSHRGPVIGASWMTKEDRLAEIRDYTRYLNTLYAEVTGLLGVENPKLTVLGFSQGASTATRWLASGEVRADRLILWGGLPAKELRTSDFGQTMNGARIIMVTGSNDRFTPPERIQQLESTLLEEATPIECVVFEGKHEIQSKVLADLMAG